MEMPPIKCPQDTGLGGILRERRKAKNLTLRRLAEISGVGKSHLGRVETGERFPSVHVLRRLAKPLDFTETELFKAAGFLSQDDSLESFKREIKREITRSLVGLLHKVDSL